MILIATATFTGTYTGNELTDKALKKQAAYERTTERLIKEGKLKQEDFDSTYKDEKKQVNQRYELAIKKKKESECNMF